MGSFVEKYSVKFPVGLATRQDFAQFAEMSVMERFYYPYFLYVDPKGVIQEEKQGSNRQYFDKLEPNIQASIAKLMS